MLLQIDEDVASLVEKIGFDKKWLIDCIQRREQTKVPLVTCYLFVGQRGVCSEFGLYIMLDKALVLA